MESSELKDLYKMQVSKLKGNFEDIYLDTKYGKSHILKCGNENGKSIVIFHGIFSNSPYNLKNFTNLFSFYRIFAIDTISDNYYKMTKVNFGEWADEVISELKLNKPVGIGVSTGGDILGRLISFNPEALSKSIFIVPGGICNSKWKYYWKIEHILKKYKKEGNEKWIVELADNLYGGRIKYGSEYYEMIKSYVIYGNCRINFPDNFTPEDFKDWNKETLLISAEKDCLFSGALVQGLGRNLFSNLKTYQLNKRGHFFELYDEESAMINEFCYVD